MKWRNSWSKGWNKISMKQNIKRKCILTVNQKKGPRENDIKTISQNKIKVRKWIEIRNAPLTAKSKKIQKTLRNKEKLKKWKWKQKARKKNKSVTL